MMDDDICYLPATQIIRLFGAKDLSPVDLLNAMVSRDQRVNTELNSFSDRYFEEAMNSARASELRWMRGDARPLEGVPIAIKDAQRLAGKRTTFGSPIFRENIEAGSDPIIERIVEAGATIHARTTTSELCISGICRSPMWGLTLNPWNPAYGPGGSSGGSGAALAAGLTTLATGTDMGGSIRVPASACGVVGYKPPHGRNPDGRPSNLDLFSHCGPLARTVMDIGLVQNIVSGPHILDHDSLRDTVHLPEEPEDIRGFRVAFSIDLGYRQVDPEVRRNTLNALDVFRQLGCDVHEVGLDWTEEIDAAFGHWFNALHAGQGLIRHAAEHPHLLSEDMLRVAAAISDNANKAGVASMFDVANRMYAIFGPILQSHDIFICPTMTIPAVAADHQMFADDFQIDGKKVDPEFGYSTTHQFNILHNCPVLSVPSGFARSGIPTGIQIVGRTFDDLSVYRAGAAFEKARGYWYESKELRPNFARHSDVS
jgi:Asp-tRNA(Asn)/Glu-tRNA(Gln) amidotransferase A subunit family amidase